jgi:phosphoglycerol transferase MdoB-like AlkP superfamily enzyme
MNQWRNNMNFDQKIKQELEEEAANIDKIMESEGGLFDRIAWTFKGGMRHWVILINVVALVVGILIAWTGYRFYLATNTESPLFWGTCFLGLLMMQGFIKNFIFMEMNRNSIMREVKRLEILIARSSPEKN